MTSLTNLVTAAWLNKHLYDDDIIVLDASMNHSVCSDSAKSLTVIPNAHQFDFETVFVDKQNTLPNMMPLPADFNREAKLLGINNNSTIVVYDNKGIFSSARAWYMFHVMGHKNVKILDGGLPTWIATGFETVGAFTAPTKNGNFNGVFDESGFCDARFVLSNIENQDVTVIDARSQGRYSGAELEPRSGMRSGHIPNAKNLPFQSLLTNNKFRIEQELKQIIDSLDLNVGTKLVFSCGSGVTACIPLFVFYNLGYMKLSVYDGSWSEWGADEQLPITLDQLQVN